MKVRLADIDPKAEEYAAAGFDDDSGVGVRYADLLLKPIRASTSDGRKITVKRRGLKLTLKIGDAKGEGLLRRLEHGPDARRMFFEAMSEAARGAGAVYLEEDGGVLLELPE